MARYHFWQFLINIEGQPIENADIYIYEAGTEIPVIVYTSETGSNTINEAPQLKTNGVGYFSFWVGDYKDTHGYQLTQKFKIAWNKDEVTSGVIDNIDIFPVLTTKPISEQTSELIPVGGITNQIMVKKSPKNFHIGWFTIGEAGDEGIIIGDMIKSVYDPNKIDNDVFNMDNMVEGLTTDNRIFTETERTNLSGHLADDGIHREINDGGTELTDLWSGSYLNTEIESRITGRINDGTTGVTDLWSGSYLNTEIESRITSRISDGGTELTDLWSGSYLNTEIDSRITSEFSNNINDGGTELTDLWSGSYLNTEIESRITSRISDDGTELTDLWSGSYLNTRFNQIINWKLGNISDVELNETDLAAKDQILFWNSLMTRWENTDFPVFELTEEMQSSIMHNNINRTGFQGGVVEEEEEDVWNIEMYHLSEEAHSYLKDADQEVNTNSDVKFNTVQIYFLDVEPSAEYEGMLRYYKNEHLGESELQMCMQTEIDEYQWVTIKLNEWAGIS